MLKHLERRQPNRRDNFLQSWTHFLQLQNRQMINQSNLESIQKKFKLIQSLFKFLVEPFSLFLHSEISPLFYQHWPLYICSAPKITKNTIKFILIKAPNIKSELNCSSNDINTILIAIQNSQLQMNKQRIKSQPNSYLLGKDKPFFFPSMANDHLSQFKKKLLKDYTQEGDSFSPSHEILHKISDGSTKSSLIAKTERRNKEKTRELQNKFHENEIYIKGSFNLSYQQKLSEIALLPKVSYHVQHTKSRPLKKEKSGSKLLRADDSQHIYPRINLSTNKNKISSISLTKENPEFINWRYRPYFQESKIKKLQTSKIKDQEEKITLLDYLRLKSQRKVEQKQENLAHIRIKLKQMQLKKKHLNIATQAL